VVQHGAALGRESDRSALAEAVASGHFERLDERMAALCRYALKLTIEPWAMSEQDLAPLRALGEPVANLVTEKPYVAQQSMTDSMQPKGFHQYWKAEFLPGLSSEYLDTFGAQASRSPNLLSFSVIFHLAGALNERDEDDGAVGNRDARYVSGFTGTWPPKAGDDDHVAWVRTAWEAIRPFSTGGNYVNFQLADDDESRTADAYRQNYQRLRRVKAEYDPDNFFRMNRNISPAAP
jgi:hypothetical protein